MEVKVGSKVRLGHFTEFSLVGEIPVKPFIPKGLVEVRRSFDYEGGLIRFKVSVRNYSDFVISDVRVRLELRGHVRIVKILPEAYAKEEYAYIPCMVPGERQSIDFYLEPFICSNIPVEVIVIYRDARGSLHTVAREPKFVSTKCPTVVTPEEVNYANLDNLFRNVLSFRARRRLFSTNEFRFLYEVVVEALEIWTGRCVERIYREKPFKAEAYFMIRSKEASPELKNMKQLF